MRADRYINLCDLVQNTSAPSEFTSSPFLRASHPYFSQCRSVSPSFYLYSIPFIHTDLILKPHSLTFLVFSSVYFTIQPQVPLISFIDTISRISRFEPSLLPIMRSSHVTLIALAVALSSTPTLSAPLFIPVNRLPTSVRTGGILPHPLFFESFKVPTAAVGSLPLNSPVGQHARREMDNLIELVARALEDDESDALNIKPIVKGLGNVVSTGLNLFDIL